MRNFRGARAEFVDDFLYTPPMEMMEKVLAKKQAEFDMASAMGATLSQHLNVDFLPDAEEEATLRQIQGHYRSQIDDLNKKIMADPMNYHKYRDWETDRKSTRLNSSHSAKSRMPSSA